MADITSANAVFIISVPLILPVPTQLQGFAADDVFDMDDVDATVTMMGVDGNLSGGMVFAEKPMNIAFMADSPSIDFFEAWNQMQQANMAAYPAQANVTLTSIGKSYQLVKGFLARTAPVPSAKRVLQPRKFRITWQAVLPLPIGSAG